MCKPVEQLVNECFDFGAELRRSPYLLLLPNQRRRICGLWQEDMKGPMAVWVPEGPELGPGPVDGYELNLHRLQLVFPRSIAGGRPRRIPCASEPDEVREALTAGLAESEAKESSVLVRQLVEVVVRGGHIGLNELARAAGALSASAYKKLVWAEVEAWTPEACLISDDLFWLAVSNEIRSGSMIRLWRFFTPPSRMGAPEGRMVNECIRGLMRLAAWNVADRIGSVTLYAAATQVERWQLLFELGRVRSLMMPKVNAETGRVESDELHALADDIEEELRKVGESVRKQFIREVLHPKAEPVPDEALLLLLDLPIWKQGGLLRRIKNNAGLLRDCKASVEYWNDDLSRRKEAILEAVRRIRQAGIPLETDTVIWQINRDCISAAAQRKEPPWSEAQSLTEAVNVKRSGWAAVVRLRRRLEASTHLRAVLDEALK